MNDLQINIQGFPIVNSDITAELRDVVSGLPIKTGRPFRDGTLTFPQVDPGMYQLVLTHPNLAGVLTQQPIRVIPGLGKTKVSILIDPSKFKNTPIEDVPDANLTPVIDAARSVEDSAKSLSSKQGGEAILANDWNTMATQISNLGHTVGQLTAVVAPQGHNHPEYERKLSELASNFDSLVTTLSASMVEIQRQLQIRRLQDHANAVVDAIADAAKRETARKSVETIINSLFDKTTESPQSFTALMSKAAADIEQIVKQNVPTPPTSGPEKNNFDRFALTVETTKASRATDYRTEMMQAYKTNVALGSVRFAS
jgi:hypothetical protein